MDKTKLFISGDLIFILSIAIACDIISGSIKATLTKSYKSGLFRTGLLKKGLDYILVIASIMVGYVLGLGYIEPATVTILIFMELSSILENCQEIISVPKVLKDIIEENKEEGE